MFFVDLNDRNITEKLQIIFIIKGILNLSSVYNIHCLIFKNQYFPLKAEIFVFKTLQFLHW